MKLFSGKNRPLHLGPYPLERLRRAELPPDDLPIRPFEWPQGGKAGGLGALARHYLAIYDAHRDGARAPQKAPVPDDAGVRTNDIKAGGYFLDASVMGICAMSAAARRGHDARATGGHDNAIVVLVEHGRRPERGNLAHGWTEGAAGECAGLRAGQIAVVLAGYIRWLGFSARAHSVMNTEVDLNVLAVRAGVLAVDERGLFHPFIRGGYALGAVTTDYPVVADRPIAPRRGMARLICETVPHWLGLGGCFPAMERARIARRASHLGAHGMETIKRVDRPTTLVLDDEIPRVSKRAAFFERALQGDLGAKAQRERSRFAMKHPFSQSMIPLIRAMVPHQHGRVAPQKAHGTSDPAANARALKSLAYFLGADLAGICEAKTFTWFSHKEDGTPIEPYHKFALVMLIDQGFDTMDGASGDDWVSGQQSMRGYMRGAEIAGVMAAHIRALGYGAASQTNALSDVLQLPLTLLSGLGELSRIGELVLNPFIGPRSKSVVLTTDMPLRIDRPIDFGLQDMCNTCNKCARECPCDAISCGGKVMFNGYEMWKPDVERCARYRLTNPHGSACGRCMKMCPYNHEGLFWHHWALKAAIRWPWTRKHIAIWDDRLGNGIRNPVKRWWLDLEIVDGVCVAPRGVNERDLDRGRVLDPHKQKLAIYPAGMMPPPDHLDPFPVDRKAALAMAGRLERPEDAEKRRAARGAPPAHDTPPAPAGTRSKRGRPVASPYAPKS